MVVAGSGRRTLQWSVVDSLVDRDMERCKKWDPETASPSRGWPSRIEPSLLAKTPGRLVCLERSRGKFSDLLEGAIMICWRVGCPPRVVLGGLFWWGAPRQSQAGLILWQELDGLQAILEDPKNMAVDSSESLKLYNDVRCEAESLQVPLKHFLDTLEKYRPALGGVGDQTGCSSPPPV